MAEMQRIPMPSPRKAADSQESPGGASPGLLEPLSEGSALLPSSQGPANPGALTYTLESEHQPEENVKKGECCDLSTLQLLCTSRHSLASLQDAGLSCMDFYVLTHSVLKVISGLVQA